MTRKPIALNAFSPIMFSTWEKALQGELSIPIGDYARAARLRQKLYQLRRSLIHDKHPISNDLKGIPIQILEQEDGTYIVLLNPESADFESELLAAGVTSPGASRSVDPQAPVNPFHTEEEE